MYLGDFVKGSKHGHGTFLFANGDRYEGQWSNDLYNGEDSVALS